MALGTLEVDKSNMMFFRVEFNLSGVSESNIPSLGMTLCPDLKLQHGKADNNYFNSRHNYAFLTKDNWSADTFVHFHVTYIRTSVAYLSSA